MITKLNKQLIDEKQISTLEEVLNEALKYHYSNFIELEKKGEPYSFRDRMGIVDFATRAKANTTIKFEVQAYINHLKRLKHFIKHFQKKGMIKEPDDFELKKTWGDLLEDDGLINVLANKWAAHRSVDFPKKGDEESLHLSVLLNLEQAITMWDNGHLFLGFENYEFNLYQYHPKILKFVDWVFKTIKHTKQA